MKLHFLGTGSSYPTTKRGVSATALQHDDGSIWLFDCGEGTQIQAQKAAFSKQKITSIFITHLHGDHLFGLPGLLCTISSQMGLMEGGLNGKGVPIVDIYGPVGINKYLVTALTISCSPLAFQFRVHELVPEGVQYPEGGEDIDIDVSVQVSHPSQLPGTCIRATADLSGNLHWQLKDDRHLHVTAGWIHHRVPTFGFVIKEEERPGRINKEKLLALGIKPGPVYGQLKEGKSFTTENGVIVTPSMVLGPPIPGRTIVILGDTKDASPLAHLVQKCDVLVHEATHDDNLKDKALEFGHSTPLQAVAFAKTIDAKVLLLNHFSQRYATALKERSEQAEDSIALLEEQAVLAAAGTSIHVQCADDLFVFEIPLQPRNVPTS